MINVAVVGLGKMGLLHASLLNVIPDCKVIAVCEKSRLLRRFSKNMFSGIRVVSDISELPELNPDVVYVTTPTSAHFSITESIIMRKICRNIFVEKPLANNAGQSRQIIELLRSAGEPGINMVGYNRRFNVVFRKAREIITAEFNGGINSYEGYAFSSDFYGSPRATKRVNHGGVLRDLGCHAIDLVTWCLGDLEVKAVNSHRMNAGGALDSVDFTLSDEKGIKGRIRASWCEPDYRLPEIGIVVEGKQGQRLSANDDKLEFRDRQGKVKTWHKQDLNDNTYYMLGNTDYYREDAEYIDAVKAGKQTEPGFGTALKVDEMVDAVEKSIAGQADVG